MKQKFSTLPLFILTLSIVFSCLTSSPAQTKNDKTSSETNISVYSKRTLPAPKGFVNDFADVIDQDTKSELERTLKSFKQDAKIDLVIATVKTTGKKTAFDYSLSVAKDWGVGGKNPDKAGILMLVVVDDRRWHIQISRSLETILSAGEVSQWGALMEPFFKEQKYGEGITKSVEKFIEVLKEKRKIR
jgi:uncharacterized protein